MTEDSTLHGGWLHIGDTVVATIRPAVAELLFTESFWDRVREAVGLESYIFDQYEGDEVPVEQLGRLAEAARSLAAGYDREGVVRGVVSLAHNGADGQHIDAITAEVPAREMRDAILAVADAADQARAANVPLWMDL